MKNITSIILSISIITLLSLIFVPADSFAATPAEGGTLENGRADFYFHYTSLNQLNVDGSTGNFSIVKSEFQSAMRHYTNHPGDFNGKYKQDTITVRVLGGLNNDYNMVYKNSPSFVVGDEIFIFVSEKEPNSIYGNNYYVAGLQHGKYILENGMYVNVDSDKNIPEKMLDVIINSVKEQRASSTR